MTAGLAITGVAHLVTAAGLRPVPRRARVLHAIGGAATLAVALLPVDAAPQAHGVAAGIGFGALALWPALAARRGATGILRPAVTVGASVALTGLLGWFVVELQGGGDLTGLSERAVAGAQAVWPLVVVVALRRAGVVSRGARRGRRTPVPAVVDALVAGLPAVAVQWNTIRVCSPRSSSVTVITGASADVSPGSAHVKLSRSGSTTSR